MDFAAIAREAKVPAIAGSIKKNPTWTKPDFDAFREKANTYCPVIECKGEDKTKPMMAKVTAAAADIEYLFVIDIWNQVVASKKVAFAGDALVFEVPQSTKGMLACCTSKLEGSWKSQPYMKVCSHNPSETEYEWKASMSHEKGACHTAPEVAKQWFPQEDRHPELRRNVVDHKPLKILYLHGHANNNEIAKRQVEALERLLPGIGHTVEILPGNVKLTEELHFASVIDYSPHLVELGLSGAKGYNLEGYGHIEAPAQDPTNDPTCQTNCKGITWAKMSKESMAHAVGKLKQKIIAEGGYDVILGFSQGGEVVQNLINELPAINSTVETKVRCISLFGTRIYHKKYGAVTAHFEKGSMRAFIVMGQKDAEDIKDASRDTDNLWDLAEFKKTYEAAGITVTTDTHEGGHEMPQTKFGGVRSFYKRFYDFVNKEGEETIDVS